MAGWLRRAGSAPRPGGGHVTWSVAEGRRGRRWREVVVDADGAVRHSLLLELDPDGRFSHLELSTAAGLLTLHPEGDGTLHGNAVTGDGVRHIGGWAWDADLAIEVEGSVVCEATWRRRDGSPFGSLQLVRRDLTLEPATRLVPIEDAAVDPDGPQTFGGGTTWPLETSG